MTFVDFQKTEGPVLRRSYDRKWCVDFGMAALGTFGSGVDHCSVAIIFQTFERSMNWNTGVRHQRWYSRKMPKSTWSINKSEKESSCFLSTTVSPFSGYLD